jgi:hypothetical protein
MTNRYTYLIPISIGVGILALVAHTQARPSPSNTSSQLVVNGLSMNGLTMNGLQLNGRSTNQVYHQSLDWIDPAETHVMLNNQSAESISLNSGHLTVRFYP